MKYQSSKFHYLLISKRNNNNIYNNNDLMIINIALCRCKFFKKKYCNVKENVKYRSWSCQDSQKLQNNASSHYPTTIFALCVYFLQYKTPLFGIQVFRTRRLIDTQSLSWLQNLNFKSGALRREKRRGLAFYTGTSCLKLKLHGLEECRYRRWRREPLAAKAAH